MHRAALPHIAHDRQVQGTPLLCRPPRPSGRIRLARILMAWAALSIPVTFFAQAARAGANEPAQGPSGAFPFEIQGDQFLRDGVPVFVNLVDYQPLEPGQSIVGEIRERRIWDDWRRWGAYRGGSDPVLLRVYPQPTTQYPVRVPASFYDNVRQLGFWVVRDIYFQSDYTAADAISKGQAVIDAVINEVETTGGMDVIFAWEIGNEFDPYNPAVLQSFLEAMCSYLKSQMQLPGREGYSRWVTWASWPPCDPLRTDGAPIRVTGLDYYSFNAYSYDPERIRDHQAGPGTGTPWAGYISALKAVLPDKPLVITETGLPDSPWAVGLFQSVLHPWYPVYRRGALSEEQVAEGLADRYWDARLAGMAGVGFFEWQDEWHKAGDPWTQADDPEEHFGLLRFRADRTSETRNKLQQQTVRDLLTMKLPSSRFSLALTADNTTLSVDGVTTIHANVSGTARQPLRFRWEATRGCLVGDSAVVTFRAGGRCTGPASVTAIAIDADGEAARASLSIAINAAGPTAIELLTLGQGAVSIGRASGRVANVDLDSYKAVVYIETNQLYVQPYTDMKSIWIGPDGYWWTPIDNRYDGSLVAWLVPRSFDPPLVMPIGSSPAGAIAWARMTGMNDSDNDLLPDAWEPNLSQGRYDDPDQDGAQNLEEYLAGTDPSVPENDSDDDGLKDNWERHFLCGLTYDAVDDPDSDGLDNAAEQDLGSHPGRSSPDRDRDGLPDAWEVHWFGDTGQGAEGDFNEDGFSNRDAYELGLSPLLTADFNGDGHVDHSDLFVFESCASGPAIAYDTGNLPPACTLIRDGNDRIAADFDQDGDVDQMDFSVLQCCFSGRIAPADPACEN